MARQLENASLQESFAATPSHHDRTFAQWAALWQSPDFQGWHVDDYLRMITVPVLAAHGEFDTSSVRDHLARLEGLCAEVETAVIPGARHAPHLDRPQSLVNELTGFVRRVAASS
jgi:pimeloyl-ACP methyl ester carboxylesterase